MGFGIGRKVILAPVPSEQIKADHENGRSNDKLENLINKEIRLR
jgi:hypothetical protein